MTLFPQMPAAMTRTLCPEPPRHHKSNSFSKEPLHRYSVQGTLRFWSRVLPALAVAVGRSERNRSEVFGPDKLSG
jgi:hypothetical protein